MVTGIKVILKTKDYFERMCPLIWSIILLLLLLLLLLPTCTTPIPPPPPTTATVCNTVLNFLTCESIVYEYVCVYVYTRINNYCYCYYFSDFK